MEERNRIPEIRFKGFNDDWEQRKLIDLCDYVDYRGKTPNKSDSGIFLVTAKNVKDGYIDYDVSKEYIPEDKYEEVMRRGKPKIGDVLITTEAPCGNVAQVNKPNIALAQRIIKYRGHNQVIDNTYLKYYLLSPFFQNILNMKSSGGTVQGIKGSVLHQQKISFTKYTEQLKIGQCLHSLDSLITLHQRKHDNLVQLKKSMLSKMFPQGHNKIPNLRFNGFTDDWEQRKLNEIVGIYDGVHQTPKYQDSGIMFLSVENISTLQSTKYISEEDFKRDYKVYPQENDILMTRIGDVGTTNVVTDNSLKAYYVSLALLKYKNTNPYFLSNAMQSNYVQKGLANRTLKTAVPMKINKDEIGKVDIILPASVEEQSKIGSYFKNIDNLITLHQRKVDKLKTVKKSMLSKMFVK